MNKVWLPLIMYSNTRQKERTRIGWKMEWMTSVTVAREASFFSILWKEDTLGLVHDWWWCWLRNNHILVDDRLSDSKEWDRRGGWKGSKNPMAMKQTYTHKFQCQFNLENYLFDKQSCSIDMKSKDLDALTTKLLPGHILMEQGPVLTLFYIFLWTETQRRRESR